MLSRNLYQFTFLLTLCMYTALVSNLAQIGCITYLLWVNKVALKISQLQTRNSYYLTVSVGQGSELGASGSGALMRLQLSCQPGLMNQGSTWGGPTSKFTHWLVARHTCSLSYGLLYRAIYNRANSWLPSELASERKRAPKKEASVFL